MLDGVCHAFSDVEFIPGIDFRNLVLVVEEIQKEIKLDLGVCQFLVSNVRNSQKLHYLGEKEGETNRVCTARESLLVAGFNLCIPPERSNCEYRKAKLKELGKSEEY